MTDLTDLDLWEHGDPDAVFAQLRRQDPVYRNPSAEPFWAVTRYADALAVYRDPATFSSARGMVLGVDPGQGDPASAGCSSSPTRRGIPSCAGSSAASSRHA